MIRLRRRSKLWFITPTISWGPLRASSAAFWAMEVGLEVDWL